MPPFSVSSFSFAVSTSHFGAAFGYAPAPAYAVYTPVYDPYFQPAWVPGTYEVVNERVWIPGRYEQVVRTPVIETVVDPLGNTYDAVVQPGSVDTVWVPGRYVDEPRRIWHPGHFEYVAVY